MLGLDSPPIPFVGTLGAILVAHVFYNTTIVIRLVAGALSRLDPSLEQAARSLGASPDRLFWRVTLPMLRPSLLAAALMVFLFDFTSFGVVLLLGGSQFSTLEVEIYYQAINYFDLPLAAWLSLIQLFCTLAFSILYSRVAVRVTVPAAPRLVSTRPALHLRERLFVIVLSLFLFTFYFLPLFSLPLRSITRLEAGLGERTQIHYGLTTSYYTELFINRRGSIFYVPPVAALGNSLAYASLTVVLSLVLGFPASLALARPGRLERLLDPLLILPLGASAVTLGLGFIVAFSEPLFSVQIAPLSSPLLVPLVYTIIALPFVIRVLQPALASIPDRLRQAAATLGASPSRVWGAVDWPIARRAVLSAVVFAFTVSLGEFGATSLVYRPEFPTLPMAIYRFLSLPGGLNYGQAMAMATILMLVTGIGILAIEKLRLPGAGEF
jgi:thiamine transport system permease protein